MKKKKEPLKANSITFYDTFKELKDSHLNDTFDPEKHKEYVEGLQEFSKLNELPTEKVETTQNITRYYKLVNGEYVQVSKRVTMKSDFKDKFVLIDGEYHERNEVNSKYDEQ